MSFAAGLRFKTFQFSQFFRSFFPETAPADSPITVYCKIFNKIWKWRLSTAIGVGMTSFTSVEISSVQTPGGVRVGSANRASFSPTGEFTTQEDVMSALTQAGGPESALRSFQIASSRSPLNGKTVASRGAGQSARKTFCWKLIEFIVPEWRTPGGIRLSGSLTR
jgi:hypothetical protein